VASDEMEMRMRGYQKGRLGFNTLQSKLRWSGGKVGVEVVPGGGSQAFWIALAGITDRRITNGDVEPKANFRNTGCILALLPSRYSISADDWLGFV
jgi:hypothetical protein